jgi:hypothetical protein
VRADVARADVNREVREERSDAVGIEDCSYRPYFREDSRDVGRLRLSEDEISSFAISNLLVM